MLRPEASIDGQNQASFESSKTGERDGDFMDMDEHERVLAELRQRCEDECSQLEKALKNIDEELAQAHLKIADQETVIRNQAANLGELRRELDEIRWKALDLCDAVTDYHVHSELSPHVEGVDKIVRLLDAREAVRSIFL